MLIEMYASVTKGVYSCNGMCNNYYSCYRWFVLRVWQISSWSNANAFLNIELKWKEGIKTTKGQYFRNYYYNCSQCRTVEFHAICKGSDLIYHKFTKIEIRRLWSIKGLYPCSMGETGYHYEKRHTSLPG